MITDRSFAHILVGALTFFSMWAVLVNKPVAGSVFFIFAVFVYLMEYTNKKM